MGRRWWVGTGAAVALVLAVLVVRPGSEADLADLSGVSSPVAGDPSLRPAALAGLGLADVPVTAGGVGPVSLGQDVEDLLAAGWQTYATGSCHRLLAADLRDATLTGWVVDDRVASVQLESTAVEVAPVASDLGFVLGTPVAEVLPPRSVEVQPLGDGTVVVSTARLPTEAGSVLVSDVGGPGIRFVEVATPDGEACEPDPSLLESSRSGGAEAALRAFGDAITVADLGHQHLSSTGSSLQDLATTGWAPLLGDLAGAGCETVVRTGDGDRTTLFLLDGVVVAEDFVLDASPLRRPPYYTPGEAYQETPEGRLRTTERVVVDHEAPSGPEAPLATTLLAGLEVVPGLDTVAVAVGPFVELQQVGRPCRVPAP